MVRDALDQGADAEDEPGDHQPPPSAEVVPDRVPRKRAEKCTGLVYGDDVGGYRGKLRRTVVLEAEFIFERGEGDAGTDECGLE